MMYLRGRDSGSAPVFELTEDSDVRQWDHLIYRREEACRATGMDSIASTVQCFLDDNCPDAPGQEGDLIQPPAPLPKLLLLLLRLSQNSPFANVREKSKHILQTVLAQLNKVF